MKYNQPTKRFLDSMSFMFLLGLAMTLLTSVKTNAATTTVSSVTALQTAINNASAGDVLILANGTYLNNTLTISKSNITVKAATSGGVYLNGSNAITISGDNVTFSGFQFTSGFPFGSLNKVAITVTGDHVIVTRLNFSGYNASKYISLQGQYDEISYCNFENKPATSINTSEKGNMIHIAQRSDLTPNYAKISYCSFKNMPGDGGDYGNECIRITNHEIAEPGSYQSRTIVEYCYFTNTGLGDSEAISVKSDNNILRYNTMVDNQTANFCFRYGDDNVAYGNFFINSGGIRIKEANNIHCYNNYFENSGNGSVSAPIMFVYDNTSVVSHLNYLNIVNNTFVGGSSIELSNSSATNNGNVPITTFTNNTFANNIFKYATGSIFSGSTSGISWAGNFRQGTLGISNPSSGMANTNPLLTLNSEGYYGLPSNSPAINASSSSYPSILNIAYIETDPSLLSDISGQARVGIKDVGCDEYSTAATTNHPLALTEVGPDYLGGPTTDEPTAASTQTICGVATVANLAATGTDLKWYTSLTTGSPLVSTDFVYSGNYYVSQTLNGIESTRKTVVVTVTSPAPIAAAQSFCSSATVASLTATGTSLKWYSVATGGSQLSSSTSLSTGTYYVSQTVSSCVSSRTPVSVIVSIPASLPVLNADGPGDTYELITSVLAPCQGVSAVEAPDMLTGTVDGTHPTFGRHIAEVMDADLGKYVFEFYSHVAEDNDITGGLDRERVEIKTYGGSTDNLKGVLGETVTYKWRFKVPTGFQPSDNFTHIHQVKAVDGDDSSPIFTLTPRYGTPNTLQLLYTQDSSTSAETRSEVNLSLFENTWVEAVETIKIGTGTTGTYAITLKKVSDGTTILSYSSNAIQTIRTSATDPATTGKVANSFIRPKWGIYRSLLDYSKLRNDSMRFSDISISEIVPPTAALTVNSDGTLVVNGTALAGSTVTVTFPDNTFGTTTAALGGNYGPITSSTPQSSGDVVVTYLSGGNNSPEAIIQYTALPVASDQSYCSGTVATLVATGTSLKWYSAATGGSALASTVALATGTYYVTQTVNGLESDRKSVSVTIAPTSAPTAVAQTVCSPATIASLVATGTDLKWYTTNSSTTVRASTYSISSTTLYVSQTLNSCESTRTAVAVTVASATAAPTGSATLTVCNTSTVANLTATGTVLKWYLASSGGSELTVDTALTTRSYYASQTITTNGVGCESSSRKSVAVTLATAIALPTASSQTFCSATVASLVATGTALKWYDSSSGGSSLASTTALTSGTYYVSQTLTSCESARTSVAVTLNSIAPTADSQIFCGSHTINDLIAQGTNLKWYDASSGGSAFASTDPLSTRTYYVTQTIDGCESTSTSVGVTVNTTQSPTVTSTQAFCASATVGNLAGNGTDLKWYNDVGTLLTLSSGLTSGTYFVSQTLNACESLKSSVAVTINSITAPTPASTQNFCASNNPTVANLSPSGTGIKWYLASGGALASSTALISGTNYYVSQNATGTCESDRSSAVAVSIISAPTAPSTSLKSYCSPSSVASLTSATGTDLKWYIASTGGSALLSTDLLTSRTYYVSQTLNGCESSRSSINVTVNGNLAPSAIAQNFCGSATVASLVATGTALKWYNEASGGTPLVSTTTLVSGTYYVSQTTDTCESPRTSVTVTVVSECDNTTTPAAPIVENSTINLCFGAVPIQLAATGLPNYTLKWYTVATSGTASITAPTIVTSPAGSKTYYVSQKVGAGLESARTPITVNIVALPPTAGTIVPSDAALCKYVDNDTEFTLTTPAVTTPGTSYVWTVPTATGSKVNISGSTTGNILTVNLLDVTQTVGGTIGNVGVRVKNAAGCVSATEKTFALVTKIPTAPSKIVLTSTEPSLSGLTAITKVGPYMGTDIEFTLTATDISNTAHHYKWELPYGVNITQNSATVTQAATLSTSGFATSTEKVINVNFLGVPSGIGALPISVYSVGGCQESVAKTLSLARVVPTAPKALALTALASNAITLPIATADKITKVSPYVKKATALTLVATPITVQGATATSYEWVFPDGVSSDDTISSTVNGVTTISSTSNIITVKFEGVDSGVLSLPISVYAVNGAGKSVAKTLTLSSAAPATPVITYSTATTTFDKCHSTTYTATSIPGATYNWTIPPGATGTSTTNSIVVDFTNVTTALTYAVTCSATNGTGTSTVKSLTIKKAATCATPRIAPEVSTAEEFKVVAYPNPSHEEGFRVKSGNGKSFGVEVFDMLGRSIEQRQMSSDSKIGSNFAKGVYNVIVTQDANVKTLRVIKK